MKKFFVLGLSALSLIGLNMFADEQDLNEPISEVEQTTKEKAEISTDTHFSSTEDKEDKDLTISKNDEEKENSSLIG